MRKILFTLLLLACTSFAATLSGTITDFSTQTPIDGANIIIQGTTLGGISDTNGKYKIDKIPAGDYTVVVSFMGYKIQKTDISIVNQTVFHFALKPEILKGQEIIVSANRAELRKTPVAFTDISAEEIQKKYWAQEVPLLLDQVPGLYSYSYTGSGLGYAEVKIRGFDATRVGITVNGVPLNDPEDHITYFYDLPDISASVRDIQVQRGVANSLYGTGAFAGSVNLQTTSSGREKFIQVNTGFGSYNTRKQTVSLSSGLVDNTYTFYSRFSKVQTDGYRDHSWVDSWSYFFSASRYDENLTTTINLFGGPMRAHFAWEGITKEELQNDHTLNYDTYRDAADNFMQPHYQLINEWTPSEKLSISSTLFFIKGDGYYEQYKYGRDLNEYNFDYFERDGEQVTETDLIRQKWVDKQQLGWIPRVDYRLGKHQLSAGAEIFTFASNHWGEVKWASLLPPGAQPNQRYYEHVGKKNSYAFFINELFELNEQLFLKADLQYRYLMSGLTQTKMGAMPGHAYDLDYHFLTPRIGLNYNLTSTWNTFFNFSMANREPKDADIYDADDPWAVPLFRTIDIEKGIYQDPYIEHETLYDFEFGAGYHAANLRFGLNLFWMNFDNEIVPTGGITDDGYPIYGNAEKSVHRGIEMDAAVNLPADIRMASNFSFSDNYFINYTEYLWNEDYSGNVAINRDGNTIAGFPEVMANLRLEKQTGPLYASLHAKYIGRSYLDNSESKELSIDPHFVMNGSLAYDLPDIFNPVDLSLSLHANNLLNAEYELSGYSWAGIGYYIPAALRNFYFSLQMTL